MYVSIKTHVIVLLIFATMLPFVLLRVFAYPIIQSDLKTVIMDNLEAIGHKQAELVTTWMRERMKDVIVVASNSNVIHSAKITANEMERKNTVKYLETLVGEYGYKGAFITDNYGTIILATSEEHVGKDISKMSFFTQAIEGKTYASNIFPSKVSLINEFDEIELGVPTMFVASPLQDEEENIIGVVALRIHVGILSNLMHSYAYGKTGESYLLNRNGYMLTESRFNKHLKKTGVVHRRSALEVRLLDPETGKLTLSAELYCRQRRL